MASTLRDAVARLIAEYDTKADELLPKPGWVSYFVFARTLESYLKEQAGPRWLGIRLLIYRDQLVANEREAPDADERAVSDHHHLIETLNKLLEEHKA